MPTLPTVPTPSKEGKFFQGGMFCFDDNHHCPLRHQYIVTHINHYVMNKYVCIIFTCPHCPLCPQCPHLLWEKITQILHMIPKKSMFINNFKKEINLLYANTP